MTQSNQFIKRDRMRYTKDGFSSGLVLLAIVFDVLYFISIYKTDVGRYYYTWVIGASVVYNLLFLLTAFLASQGVKNRKNGYGLSLVVIGLMQIVRIFYLPAKAFATQIEIGSEMVDVMTKSQHTYVVACLVASAVCCVVAAVSNYISNQQLARHMREIEKKSA